MLTIAFHRFEGSIFQNRIPPTHMRGRTWNLVCRGSFGCSFIWTGQTWFLGTFTNPQFYLGPVPFENDVFSSREYGNLDRILLPFKNLFKKIIFKKFEKSIRKPVCHFFLNFEYIKTEAGAVSVDENVFLFGGFDQGSGDLNRSVRNQQRILKLGLN